MSARPSTPSPPAIGTADDDVMKVATAAAGVGFRVQEDTKCEETKVVLQLGKNNRRNPPSIYHQGCAPEDPERNFTATPIPRRLLKGRL